MSKFFCYGRNLVREVRLLLILSLFCIVPAIAQSPNATINGIVLDPSGAAIAGAQVVVVNDATGVQYIAKTSGEGIYVVPNLPEGTYRVQVSISGFKTIIKPDIVLHIQDALAINFTLPVGAASEIMTVQGGAPLLNTSDGSLSTVVDHNFVENMPLNGRSFQDLILLTPGVVTISPMAGASLGYNGEFSVNGQRTESNSYSVDGVSANLGVIPTSPVSVAASGSLPSATSLGTTQSLVSVDALQEFRVQSSSYSAEFGRTPGGQFDFVTRSGTSQWHGTVFDYVRNDLFDANDWFNDYYAQKEPPLRQNDFGGTLGGPVYLPRSWEGNGKTFFFFSYEGLRVTQPQPASVNYVPDVSLRQSAPSALQPVLNAFPLPNGLDLGNGLAEFTGTWSNTSSVDSYSLRLDQTAGEKLKLFFRFSETPSNSQQRGTGDYESPADNFYSFYKSRTYTAGWTSLFSARASDDFRLNYSSNEASSYAVVGGFAGGQSVNLAQLQGINEQTNPYSEVLFFLLFAGQYPVLTQFNEKGEQRQWNFVDTLDATFGRHQLKIGGDYRRLTPFGIPVNPYASYFYFDAASVEANAASGSVLSNSPAYPLFTNFSAFIQDEWRLIPRLNLSMGLRWEVNPPPGTTNGNQAYTVEGSSLSALTLAPQGTALWKTTWYNLAPRLGAAYTIRNSAGWETVLRGGGGVFFDSGQQEATRGFQGVGFTAVSSINGGFPVPPSQLNVPIVNPPVAPYTSAPVYAFSPHLQLPYTLQWNGTIEQVLGKSETLTMSYVGAHAARLLETNEVDVSAFDPNFGTILFTQNGLTSDYNALQARYQRRLSRGLQALASYTWSHSIDYGSTYTTLPYTRGNSDFDVRHNFSAAFSYTPSVSLESKFARAVLGDWAFDDRLTARSGFPVTLDGMTNFDPATGQAYNSGLNVVPGQPVYLYGSQCVSVFGNPCIGGRAINPNAFSVPSVNQVGDAPRNFLRGFGAWQMDLAVRREFPLHERLKLQFRADAFNIFNHPNFGYINPYYCSPGPGCTFGEATATLAESLGVLSPLYQMGGPRSMQFALKLLF